jgi:hypothetical protein
MEPQVTPVARLVQLEGTWVVRVERANGRPQDYRCVSEEQAKQLLLVLAPRAN